MRRVLRRLLVAVAGLWLGIAATDIVMASNIASGLQGGDRNLQVATWLYLATGGAAVGASGLLAMFVTDRQLIDRLHRESYAIPTRETAIRWARLGTGVLAVVGLVLVVYTGLTGPRVANANFAVLAVFVGGRAGLVMVAYLVGNVWPAIDPWRTIVRPLPSGFVEYPDRWGVWPAVGGLLAILLIEVIAAPAQAPGTLAVAVVAYSVYTLAGAVAFSPSEWFHYGDPLAVLFRYYGAVAPIQRTAEGFEIGLPGARLRDGDVIDGFSGAAFVVLLVWELTYGAFIVTPPGTATVEFLVGLGIPPAVTYLLVLLAGYGLFFGIYWLGARYAKRFAETYLTAEYLTVRFGPPLLAIAAGYHLTHYFSFFVSLSPSLVLGLSNPLSPPVPPLTLALPNWFGLLNIAFILIGHLLAIWAAHAAAFDVFPSRVQAIRSQYPVILVMIGYTMISLWLISLPTAAPPFVG